MSIHETEDVVYARRQQDLKISEIREVFGRSEVAPEFVKFMFVTIKITGENDCISGENNTHV